MMIKNVQAHGEISMSDSLFCVFKSAPDGLISYSAPEGQLMMPPGSPIACLNDSTYDGVHERRRVKRTFVTTSLLHAGCV